MKFKKLIIIGSIMAGVATVASTAVVATQINHQNTKDSPNIMMKRNQSLRLSNHQITNRYTGISYEMETQNPHEFNRRYSKYHYDNQAYGARYFLKTKAPGSSTWTTVKEGFRYYILNDDDIEYDQDITWNINKNINLENEFKIDVVFDDARVEWPSSVSGEDSSRYVEYYTNFPISMRTRSGSVTMENARFNYIWTSVADDWLREQGGRVGELSWKAFNTHNKNHPTANTLINSSAFSQILGPVNDSANVFNNAKLKSLKFKIKFKGQDPSHILGLTRLEIYGNSKIKARLEALASN